MRFVPTVSRPLTPNLNCLYSILFFSLILRVLERGIQAGTKHPQISDAANCSNVYKLFLYKRLVRGCPILSTDILAVNS